MSKNVETRERLTGSFQNFQLLLLKIFLLILWLFNYFERDPNGPNRMHYKFWTKPQPPRNTKPRQQPPVAEALNHLRARVERKYFFVMAVNIKTWRGSKLSRPLRSKEGWLLSFLGCHRTQYQPGSSNLPLDHRRYGAPSPSQAFWQLRGPADISVRSWYPHKVSWLGLPNVTSPHVSPSDV